MSKEKDEQPAVSEEVTETVDAELESDLQESQEPVPSESEEKEEIAAAEARVRELEEEVSSLKDQYLRKQADFENFRKRMLREKEEALKFANSNLLSDLITIIDDFERAIKSSNDSRDFDSFHSGIELIEKQFTAMLDRKYGLKRFESLGEEFDPQKHEALMMGGSADHDSQVVLEDFQRGYILHDRVLRHAKVKVSNPVTMPPEEESETAEAETT
ncbi:MAG: nucleotide exchange factor GrpE [Spirochaetales bacterium]|nr:nucleotide exchange factor GrpE [Spirochaetales bacterium]